MRLLQFKTTPEMALRPLNEVIKDFLCRHFSDRQWSDHLVKQLIHEENVFVAQKLCKDPKRPIKAKGEIAIFVENLTSQFKIKSEIVYEDDFLIAINKPSGLPTQATLDPRREHLYGKVIELLSLREEKKLAYVGLHHRLDQDTSGVVIFSKVKSINKDLGELFSQQKITKTYLAVSKNKPEKSIWTVKNHLKKSPNDQHRFYFQSTRSGGQIAETKFEHLGPCEKGHLIQAQPKTGRTHQIRVHLHELGLSIAGDRVYQNSSTKSDNQSQPNRMLLHCQQLEFLHPHSKEKIVIRSEAPKEFDLIASDQ